MHTYRKHQYTACTDWPGGLYISPGFAGSRSGAMIASAWASMVHLGAKGYLEATACIMMGATRFAKAIHEDIEGIEVIGEPEASVVAFRASTPKKGGIQKKPVDVYKVNDLMSKKGWHLNALQRPPALHVCFTAAHGNALVEEMIQVGEEKGRDDAFHLSSCLSRSLFSKLVSLELQPP
jgi:sphinganine-1-phosphate aldolase